MANGVDQNGTSNESRDVPFWIYALLPPIPLAIEAISLAQGKAFHSRIFSGEFGFWEIGTVLLSLFCVFGALYALLHRPRFPWRSLRVTFIVLAVGCFYLAGEEMSWGQHFFGWEAEGKWAELNYQKETNFHNIRNLAFTNTVPRNLLTLFAIVAGVLGSLLLQKRRQATPDHWKRPICWLCPTNVCGLPALFVLLPPIPKKLGLPSMPEPGETEEFYMALFLAIFILSILIRKISLSHRLEEVSSAT